MGKYFGTDGFRGEANKNLTAEHAYKIGRFLGWYYGRNKEEGEKCKIVIGKDTRLSSYMFEYALVSGLTASGGLSASCNHDSFCLLCGKNRGFRLWYYDFRQPQSLL